MTYYNYQDALDGLRVIFSTVQGAIISAESKSLLRNRERQSKNDIANRNYQFTKEKIQNCYGLFKYLDTGNGFSLGIPSLSLLVKSIKRLEVLPLRSAADRACVLNAIMSNEKEMIFSQNIYNKFSKIYQEMVLPKITLVKPLMETLLKAPSYKDVVVKRLMELQEAKWKLNQGKISKPPQYQRIVQKLQDAPIVAILSTIDKIQSDITMGEWINHLQYFLTRQQRIFTKVQEDLFILNSNFDFYEKQSNARKLHHNEREEELPTRKDWL